MPKPSAPGHWLTGVSRCKSVRTVWRIPTHLYKFLKTCLDKMWVEEKNMFRKRQDSVTSGGRIELCYGWELPQPSNGLQEMRGSERRQSKGKYSLERSMSIFSWREKNSSTMTQMLNKCKVQQDTPGEGLTCSYSVQGLEERITRGSRCSLSFLSVCLVVPRAHTDSPSPHA